MSEAKPIELLEVKIEYKISKEVVEKYGGLESYKDLVGDIIDRYANEDYFDLTMIDEDTAEAIRKKREEL